MKVVEIFEADRVEHGADFVIVRADVPGDEAAQFLRRRLRRWMIFGPGKKPLLPASESQPNPLRILRGNARDSR